MKRTVLLLSVLLLLIGSIDASATCWKCHAPFPQCVISATGPYMTCDDSQGFCNTTGDCVVFSPIESSLATQYTVASVERLDEPRTASPAVKVARNTSKPTRAR